MASDVFQAQLLKMQAVYWPPLGIEQGSMTFDQPVEIKCLWIDRQIEYLNPKGERQISRCTVVVDRDLKLGGALWLGKLEDTDDQDEPFKNEGANIIQGWNKVPVPPGMKKFARTAIC